MYGKNKKGEKTRKINRRGLKEVVKYATKAASFASKPDRVEEFLLAFENVHRMQAFGSFKETFKQADKEAKDGENPKAWEPCGCNCGMCKWADVEWKRNLLHISQTVLALDGTRQLRLFDSGADPPNGNTVQHEKTVEQVGQSLAPTSRSQAEIFAIQQWLVV
jgi:hypothetical protein